MAKSKTATPDTDAADVEPTEPAAAPDPDVEPDDETAEQRRERLNRATVSVVVNGETFTIPKRKGRWRMGVHRHLDRGEFDEALIKLIGEDRYTALDLSGKWCMDDFSELADKMGDAIAENCIP